MCVCVSLLCDSTQLTLELLISLKDNPSACLHLLSILNWLVVTQGLYLTEDFNHLVIWDQYLDDSHLILKHIDFAM